MRIGVRKRILLYFAHARSTMVWRWSRDLSLIVAISCEISAVLGPSHRKLWWINANCHVTDYYFRSWPIQQVFDAVSYWSSFFLLARLIDPAIIKRSPLTIDIYCSGRFYSRAINFGLLLCRWNNTTAISRNGVYLFASDIQFTNFTGGHSFTILTRISSPHPFMSPYFRIAATSSSSSSFICHINNT